MAERPELTRAIVIAILAVGLLLGSTATSDARSRTNTNSRWCGWSTRSDWLCKWRGAAFLGGEPLSDWQPHELRGSTTVSTPSGSSARVALRRQARCAVGANDRESKIVTRPSAHILIQQQSGNSICGTPHRANIELCTLAGCHTKLRAQGAVISSVLPEEATTSTTESIHRRIVVVSCSGFISVSAGGQFASGGAGPGSRFVIEIDEYTYFTEDESRTETPTEIRAEAKSEAGQEVKVVEIGELPGRGPCRGRLVHEEERHVGP